MKTIKDGKCPKCKTKMIIREGMFNWRGNTFSGLVCEKCNALYNNPKDSFETYLKQDYSS